MKCTCPTQRPNARDPTQPIFHWKWGSRLLPNAKKSLKKKEMYMADARNLRHLTQNIPTCWYPCVRWRRSTIFCVRWRKSTRRQIFCVLVEYRLKWKLAGYKYEIRPFLTSRNLCNLRWDAVTHLTRTVKWGEGGRLFTCRDLWSVQVSRLLCVPLRHNKYTSEAAQRRLILGPSTI